MQLFYHPELTKDLQEIAFDKTESRHIIRVLRKKNGDQLHITNGKGLLAHSEIISAHDKQCIVRIQKLETKEKQRNYHLHIAIAPTKNNDRLEWFLEKATEIGVDEITPIICEHSERKVIKTERLQKIIEAASKQSLHLNFPVLHRAVNFDTFIKSTRAQSQFIAHCEDTQKSSLQERLSSQKDILILIGPEGDFSHSEIEMALAHNFLPVSLGNSRLRTETAGIVAVHSVALMAQ